VGHRLESDSLGFNAFRERTFAISRYFAGI